MEEFITGVSLGPRVLEAMPQEGHRLLLHFDNGETRLFDATVLLDKKPFRSLINPEFFSLVTVKRGTIEWPGDIDYCPDTLYIQSQPT